MTLSTRYLTTAGLIFIATAATAADAPSGKTLHDGNCTQCHINIVGGDGNDLYTRKDRRVTTLPGLKKQVQRCKSNAGLAWNAQQVDAVTAHLNDTYYHLKAEK